MKKALLVYGTPQEEDAHEFYKSCNRDIGIMSDIARANGYDSDTVSDFDLEKTLGGYLGKDIDFLFYFTGHSNGSCLGHHSRSLDEFFDAISNINGEKIIILDSCTEGYIPSKKFPEKTKVFGNSEGYNSRSLAKIFFDAVMCYDKKLSEINKSIFDEMKHNWIYVGGAE